MKLTDKTGKNYWNLSLPPWERGLKSSSARHMYEPPSVAPPVGAWIEITDPNMVTETDVVAPPVGAWIEIICAGAITVSQVVAPPVGAWIEI